MSLAIDDIEYSTRSRALIFSIDSLRQLNWVAAHCPWHAFFTELVRFVEDATSPRIVLLPAVVIPKRHITHFCKAIIVAERATTRNRVWLFERGDHGRFCALTRTIHAAIRRYRYYEWTRRQSSRYPNRTQALEERYIDATVTLRRVRRSLFRLHDMIFDTILHPDTPTVIFPQAE